MLSWQVKAYNIIQHAVHIIVNNKVKGRILAKRINVYTNILSILGAETILFSMCEEKWKEEKGSKGAHGLN